MLLNLLGKDLGLFLIAGTAMHDMNITTVRENGRKRPAITRIGGLNRLWLGGNSLFFLTRMTKTHRFGHELNAYLLPNSHRFGSCVLLLAATSVFGCLSSPRWCVERLVVPCLRTNLSGR